MISIQGVHSSDIYHAWDEMLPFVEQALEHSGTHTPDDVLQAISEREMQAYVVVDDITDKVIGAIVTEILNYPNGRRVLNMVVLAGERFDEWHTLGDQMMRAWAKSIETPIIQLIGRRGWTRKLASDGWREQSVVMTLDLRN